MSALQKPGILVDRWPWGPRRVWVTVPKHYAPAYCDEHFVVVRSIEDLGDRSYQEREGSVSPAQIITRREAPGIFEGSNVVGEELEQLLAQIDRALGRSGELPEDGREDDGARGADS